MQDKNLSELVEMSLQGYFTDLQGERPTGLYEMVLQQMEMPLLKTVLQYVDNNQSHAAQILGINRNTLRKKLLKYELIDDE